MIKMLQERAGCKMQMIQDGPYTNTPEKPLRMTGFAENCKVQCMYVILSLSTHLSLLPSSLSLSLSLSLSQKARQLVLDLLEQKDLEVSLFPGFLFSFSSLSLSLLFYVHFLI